MHDQRDVFGQYNDVAGSRYINIHMIQGRILALNKDEVHAKR